MITSLAHQCPRKEAGNQVQTQAENLNSNSHSLSFFLSVHIDPKRRYLYFQILGGKAFLEHLQEPDKVPGGISSTYTLCLGFRNQRFRSKPVPCACEPDLQESFLLEVHQDAKGK